VGGTGNIALCSPYSSPRSNVTVNSQGKWETFRTKVNRHFRACSSASKAVNYHSKGGVSHGTINHRPVLVQTFISQPANKALREGIFNRLPR
jgi:hypothetical protein